MHSIISRVCRWRCRTIFPNRDENKSLRLTALIMISFLHEQGTIVMQRHLKIYGPKFYSKVISVFLLFLRALSLNDRSCYQTGGTVTQKIIQEESSLLFPYYETIESLTQASTFFSPQLASSLLDSADETQRVQVSTLWVAVNFKQRRHN